MRQNLVKFFYRELLRLQEYDKTILLYTKGRAFACGENAKVNVVESKIYTNGPNGEVNEFPGSKQIDIHIPVINFDGGYDEYLRQIEYSFKNHDLMIRYTDGNGEQFYTCEVMPTNLVIPNLGAIPSLELTAVVNRMYQVE